MRVCETDGIQRRRRRRRRRRRTTDPPSAPAVDVAKVRIRPGFQESGDDLMSVVDGGVRQGTLASSTHSFTTFISFVRSFVRVSLSLTRSFVRVSLSLAAVDCYAGCRITVRCLKHKRGALFLQSRQYDGGERWKRDESR